MTTKPNLSRLFHALQETLKTELGIAREVFDHPTTKGDVSEEKWIDMLRRHLPSRYQVNKAFIVDSKDCISEQQDVVIHDRQYSPFVVNYGSAFYVPAESVYAVLEVKPTINARYVGYAGNKIASVRGLHRTSLPIKHAGGEYPAKPPHHILGGIVTLDSDWTPPLGESLHSALAAVPAEGRLDFGCVVRHGVFSVNYAQHEPPAVAAEASSAPLALFLLRLIAQLQAIATVPCIDVVAYAAMIQGQSSGASTTPVEQCAKG